MSPRKDIPPALVKQLRYEYEETSTPIDELAARAGMTRKPFYKRIHELGWSMRFPGRGGANHSSPLSTFDGKREAAAKVRHRKPGPGPATPSSAQSDLAKADSAEGKAVDAKPPAPATPAVPPLDRQQLAARIQRSIERELDAIERVLDLLQPQNGNEAERAARTLAALARTLREVATLDTDTSVEPDHDDDAGPRDMDEFRHDLARQIESIIAERES
jgi:hypothetical protein